MTPTPSGPQIEPLNRWSVTYAVQQSRWRSEGSGGKTVGEPELATLAMTVATTVVAAMATGAWESTRDGVA
jgi:hypothetical protein